MAITYEPIATQTLGSAAASVTFSSIPSTYTDLVIVISGKSTRAGGQDIPIVRFNSDTSTNYSTTNLDGGNSVATSTRWSNETSGFLGFINDSLATASGNLIFNIMNYANTTTYKTVLSRYNHTSTNVTYGRTGSNVCLWRKTPEAISTVAISCYYANWDTGSTFSIYGIKSA